MITVTSDPIRSNNIVNNNLELLTSMTHITVHSHEYKHCDNRKQLMTIHARDQAIYGTRKLYTGIFVDLYCSS